MYEHFVRIHSCRSVQSSSEIAHSNKNALPCSIVPKRAVIVDTTCAQESLHSKESVLKQFSGMAYVLYGYSVPETEPWEQKFLVHTEYILGKASNCRQLFRDKR